MVGGVYPNADTTLSLVIPIVTLSFVASGLIVTLEPTNVRESDLVSAATVVVPTTTLAKAFWFTSAPLAIPSNLLLSELLINPLAFVVAAA